MKTKQQVIVHLRTRETADGRQQLYLDITEYGKRRKEALHMAYLPGKDRSTRKHNDEVRMIAETKARTREKELIDIAEGLTTDSVGPDRPFFQYFKYCADQRTGNTRHSWYTAYNHLRNFEDDDTITFRRINPAWVRRFVDYLSDEAVNLNKNNPEPLDPSTQRCFFKTLKACINQALSEGVIQHDPTKSVKIKSVPQQAREHLTIEEFKLLQSTPYSEEISCRAFLFSCMTGLRISDIRSLQWSNLETTAGNTYIKIVMQKTREHLVIPVNRIALSLIGDPATPDSLIFAGIPSYQSSVNHNIKVWAQRAGIKKNLSFHCSRHTFACLALQSGADLYTTSKLLGHTDVKTTQIYAKIVDASKVEAVNNLANII